MLSASLILMLAEFYGKPKFHFSIECTKLLWLDLQRKKLPHRRWRTFDFLFWALECSHPQGFQFTNHVIALCNSVSSTYSKTFFQWKKPDWSWEMSVIVSWLFVVAQRTTVSLLWYFIFLYDCCMLIDVRMRICQSNDFLVDVFPTVCSIMHIRSWYTSLANALEVCRT